MVNPVAARTSSLRCAMGAPLEAGNRTGNATAGPKATRARPIQETSSRPLSFPPVQRDLALAVDMADEADRISMERFRAHDLQIDTKPDLSPVTEVDHAIERGVRDRILRERPAHAVMGEEFGLHGDGAAAWRWVIDPID